MRPLKVLVACEESQAVCIEFRKLGHEAYSCDLQECSGGHPEWHLNEDIMNVINRQHWDLMIGHPPCTYLSYVGTRHWNENGRVFKRIEALNFFAKLWTAPIDMICLENPKGCASPTIAKYSQEIQPYYFGDNDLKTTWLWLKNLPKLEYTLKDNLFEFGTAANKPDPIYILKTSGKKIHFTEARHGSKIRSKTFPGIAKAMAEQWSEYILKSFEIITK